MVLEEAWIKVCMCDKSYYIIFFVLEEGMVEICQIKYETKPAKADVSMKTQQPDCNFL